ncbi:arylsulfatase [Bacteroidales bacterium]|nr:arylsulfatase [Bacteroidales bacterium]
MKYLLYPLLALALLFGACSKTEKPNVILVITDDQGYGDLSCHGNPWLKTPNIDQLYDESVRLTDFHVTSTCSPTRGALMTGHYTNRAGSWHTIASREMVFEHETMFPEILKQNGYSTAMFGKWHLGDNHPHRPQDRGFDETFVHLAGGVGQSPDYWGNDYFDDVYFRNGKPEQTKGYCTDVWFDNAMDYIEKKTDAKEPFFCYLSTNAPHGPYYVADEFSAPYKGNKDIVNPGYYGMIANLDQNMGKLMTFMDEKGISDNTILIFMTDNGTTNGGGLKHKKDGFVFAGYNAGMRGSKVSMYEGGHRVPFIIRWPNGKISGGRDIEDLTAHIDFFPTMVEALGLKGTESLDFDGVSLMSLLTGKVKNLAERVIVTDTQRNLIPVKWKMCSTMKDKWRLINGKHLYDLSSDPEQRTDISTDHPELVEELRAAYDAWWTDISPVYDTYQHITLCDSSEPVTVIASMEILSDGKTPVIWKQEHVRDQIENFKGATGYYNVEAKQAGTYKFTLMRYPPEANMTLNATAPAVPKTEGTNVVPYNEAIALNIKNAMLKLGEADELIEDVDAAQNGYSFMVNLQKGQMKLRAHFETQEGDIYPAMYIKVERK